MNTWLYRQFSGSIAALASWQPTHQTAVRTLRRMLRAHQRRGRSIDPSKITGELEHRYSVCKGPKLIAVYWLSASNARRTSVSDPTRAAAPKPRLSGHVGPR